MRVLTVCSDTVNNQINQQALWAGYDNGAAEQILMQMAQDLKVLVESLNRKVQEEKGLSKEMRTETLKRQVDKLLDEINKINS